MVNKSRTTDSVMCARMVPDEVVLSQDLLWLAGFPSGCNRSAREPLALFAGLALVVAGNCDYLWMSSSSVQALGNSFHACVPHVLMKLGNVGLAGLPLCGRHLRDELGIGHSGVLGVIGPSRGVLDNLPVYLIIVSGRKEILCKPPA